MLGGEVTRGQRSAGRPADLRGTRRSIYTLRPKPLLDRHAPRGFVAIALTVPPLVLIARCSP
jgi:hypothetical protein